MIIIGFLIIGCKERTKSEEILKEKIEFNEPLANKLKKMAEVDQLAAWNAFPPENYKHFSQEKWNTFKDSIYRTHQNQLKQIFDQYGYPGFNLVGKEGALNFWVMVQHSDHDVNFQKEVLEKMEIEVKKGNASPSNYGLLVDRVKINTGQEQVYGTQVDYNFEIAQAYPKSLTDSINVNERRKSIGLEPIEQYLNDMTLMNFEMNKEFYLKKGITEPKLYKVN